MFNKPPKASIRSLIRQAIFNRYGIKAIITKDGKVNAASMGLAPVDEWRTTRSDSGNVRLYQRHVLMFTFHSGV